MSLNGKMGRKHEDDLVDLLGGYRTVASGSTWRDQMDGRLNRDRVPFAFAWDGKSTLGKSVGVSRAMWEKAVAQACGERPMLALRFYDTERLDVGLDLAVVNLHDFAEMLEQVNAEQPPLRIFVSTVKSELGVHKGALLIKPDGKTDHAKAFSMIKSLMDPTQIEVDGKRLTEADGPVEVYVDNVLEYAGWPGTRWMTLTEDLDQVLDPQWVRFGDEP